MTPYIWRAHPDSNQGPADLRSAALTTELCTQLTVAAAIWCAFVCVSAQSMYHTHKCATQELVCGLALDASTEAARGPCADCALVNGCLV